MFLQLYSEENQEMLNVMFLTAVNKIVREVGVLRTEGCSSLGNLRI